jgi:ribosome-associated heat shock protein Hsp15
MLGKEKLRLDKYLWAIRLFKTRSDAAQACAKGKVKYHGDAAKASKQVHSGDEYEIRKDSRRWRIKVTGWLDSCVQNEEAEILS